jgi:hypothetical protein
MWSVCEILRFDSNAVWMSIIILWRCIIFIIANRCVAWCLAFAICIVEVIGIKFSNFGTAFAFIMVPFPSVKKEAIERRWRRSCSNRGASLGGLPLRMVFGTSLANIGFVLVLDAIAWEFIRNL